MRMIQLYDWDLPHRQVQTTDGSMEYKDWLVQEQERLRSRHRTAILDYRADKMSLYVDDKSVYPVK